MRRTFPLALSALLVLSVSATAAAHDSLDRIGLPDGWQPEGITTDSEKLYVGSLADGAVWKADPATGEGDVLVSGVDGAMAVGLDIGADGTLWVAGGRTGQIRAYDAASGELLATYTLDGTGFLNDVAATPEAVYVSDSNVPHVITIPLGDGGALPAAEAVAKLPISGELEYGDGLNLNGIVALPAGLVAVHTARGELFRIDPVSGESFRIDTSGIELSDGDGLESDGTTLFVVRNRANTLARLELDEGATTATLLDETRSDAFDVPTTAALVGDDLWLVNARFGTASEEDDAYWITRVDVGPPEEG